MAALSLSRAGRAYVSVVVAAGSGVIIYALLQLSVDPPHHYWLLLAVLTLFSGPLAIRVHSIRTTISVSETFVFASVLLFGPAPAALTAALDGLMVSLWARHKNGYRTLFNIAEPAVSVWVAAQLFGSSQGSVQLWPVPWLISQALSSTYVAGEHRLYLERNCRLSESPAHGTRRKSRGACQCQGAEQSARVRPSGKTSAKVQAAFHECSWFVAL